MKPRIALAATLALAGLSAQAADIVLFNTGVDDAHQKLGAAAPDPHWSIVAGPGIATPRPAVVLSTQNPSSAYFQSSESAWVWVAANATGTLNAPYTFRLSFDLTGLDPSTAVLSGAWGADNRGGFLLNGAVPEGTGIVSPASPSLNNFRQANPFTITGGFVSGINTLDFVITDLGVPGGLNVTALQGTAAAVPEPATSAMFLAAGLGFVAWRRLQARDA